MRRITPFYISTFICKVKLNREDKKSVVEIFIGDGIDDTVENLKTVLESFGGSLKSCDKQISSTKEWIYKIPILVAETFEITAVKFEWFSGFLEVECYRVLTVQEQDPSMEIKFVGGRGVIESFWIDVDQLHRNFHEEVLCKRPDSSLYYASIKCSQNDARHTLAAVGALLVVDEENKHGIWRDTDLVASYHE